MTASPTSPDSFDLQLRTRIVSGPDSVDRLGEHTRELGVTRALLVTDPGVARAGHVDCATTALEEAGIAVTRYDGVRENPTTVDVDACLEAAREVRPDVLVAVGGGSSLDTAKGTNFLFSGGGRMEDYWGTGKARGPMLPLVAVPTTAGTGSEVQSYALISRVEDHQKMACGDPGILPRVAILDPTLTASQPRLVAACTGFDALTHALETAVTTRRNPVSMLFARESFRLANQSLPQVLTGQADEPTRAAMLLAAAWAGLAIEHSMLGAAHSMANPLTAHHGLVHGQAVGAMLPHVVRFNGAEPVAAAEYRLLARSAGLVGSEASEAEAVEALAARVEALLGLAGMPTDLAASGVTEAEIGPLAGEAARQWTARFNPRPVGEADFRGLYRRALGGEG